MNTKRFLSGKFGEACKQHFFYYSSDRLRLVEDQVLADTDEHHGLWRLVVLFMADKFQSRSLDPRGLVIVAPLAQTLPTLTPSSKVSLKSPYNNV